MRKFLHSAIEGLYHLFTGHPAKDDTMPFKNKLFVVIGWFAVIAFCFFMISLPRKK